MTPGEPQDPNTLAYRVGQVEHGLRELTRHLDSRLDALTGSIAGLSFVRTDLYNSERAAMAKQVEDARVGIEKDLTAVKAIAMWALGVVVSAVVGAIIFAVVASVQ